MKLDRLKTYLESPDASNRMKAIVELRHHEPSVVVPLLKQRMYDKEFVVRSFVAMGLGYKRSDEAFQILLDLIKGDRDANVRAEAANSLANYGEAAIPYLAQLFQTDSNWLVRYSILAAIGETAPSEVILQLSDWGLMADDLLVQLTSIANLGRLKGTNCEEKAVDLLFELATSEIVEIRIRVAKTLRYFDSPQAQAALTELRHDSDYRVLAAILEGAIKNSN